MATTPRPLPGLVSANAPPAARYGGQLAEPPRQDRWERHKNCDSRDHLIFGAIAERLADPQIMSEDDIAVATILQATGTWARGEGPEPYPLAQGCQDHAIALAIEESARTGADVRVVRDGWAS